jgi:3-oxoacyl-[acyl-carrier-protein] synthase I
MDRLELAGSGHAGVLQGIAAAAEHLRARRQSLCAVGGVDSYLDVYTIAALASQRRIAVEGVRGGFHPGEGAGFLVLALASTARQLGLPSLAKVRGAFADTEERSIVNGGEPLGHGLVAAIAGAAGGLRLPGETVDAAFCDINGERYRSEEWAMAILRAPHLFAGSGYEAPANLWGDVGAAWGALGCVLAVRSWAREYAKGPRALVWGSSDAGLRAAAVLERDNAGEAPWPR